jgi:hypothetical protein
LALPACRASEKSATVAVDSARPWAKPGDTIDSIFPMPELLRRFRVGLVEPTELEGGAPSRDALAARFIGAIATHDTAALRGMLLSRAEFGWLMFPDHRYAEPPYELDPGIFWLQLTAENSKGVERVLQRYGGQPLAFERLTCTADTLQMLRGPTTVWGPCSVRYRTADSTLTRRLFGSMIERNGRVKLVSYNNDF